MRASHRATGDVAFDGFLNGGRTPRRRPDTRDARRRLARAAVAAAHAVRFEPLEGRRMLSVAINGSVTLDESGGLQTGGVAVAGEDNNDSDVALSTLPASFSSRLFGAPAGGLGLSSTFAAAVGAAESASNYITVTETGAVVSLGFSKADGTALPVFGGATPGVASGLSALNGGAISLFADSSSLGNRMVLGVDAAGDVACALFLEPNAALTSAKVWMVQLEALSNPNANNPDDPLTMGGLGIAAGVSTEFNFNALPSGQNLFGTVGTTASGLVVIGKTPVLNADGTFTNASNTINTSQGGGPTTIGVNNQMFDPGDGAYFTFVKNPVANFLAGAPNGLDQNEADDADNIQYTGGTIETNTSFVKIAQLQGGGSATMDIKAFDMAGAPQGQSFATSGLGSGTAAPITAVRVFNAAGQKIEDSALPGQQNPAVSITITNGVARVAGVDAGYRIEWDTSAKHDQVLITGVGGKFDIGGFGLNEATSSVEPLTGIRYEDDGPSITGTATGAPTLTVDETVLGTDATGAFAAQFTPNFGSDGAGATPVSYALSTPGGNSGLVDTATGEAVILSLVGGQVQGRTAVSNDLVFTVSVDGSGNITLDQLRAIVHPTADPDESKTLLAANLVVLTATASDKDADTAAAGINIGQLLVLKDDGPSITATAQGAPTLTVDETVLATNASGSFAAQFTPAFGADGAGATPVAYALSTPGGNSGLVDTATGNAVFLFKVGDDVVGRAGADATAAASGPIVFVVSVNASGVVTLDQQRAVVHPTADPDESKTLLAANLVVLTATANDKDGDSASTPLNIGQLLVFKDDGPAITATAQGAPTLTVDETVLATNATGAFAAQFTPTFGADGAGATPVTYALSTAGGDSGLVDTASGQAVMLSLVGGQVQGRTAVGNDLVFTVSVDGSGNVTLDQIRAIVHPTADPDESKTLLANNLVALTATAHDKDGDNASAPLNIGQLLVFKDDGPSITATAQGAPTLTVDETVLGTDATGAFAAQFTPVFGADGAGATPRTYALSTPGGNSGLVDTATGQAVVLSLVGGQVQGRTAVGNDLVFTVSVDANGNVTLDQVRAVVHPTADPDESKTLAAANLVVLTGSAHDKDGDSASAPLNIGQLLVFKDDGPSITATPTDAPTLTVDESALGTDDAKNFAGQFTPTFGADGPGATPRSYALKTAGGASGLVDTATGENVVLSLSGGVVEGRTASTNLLVFTVSVDQSGNVTLDQKRAVKHTDANDHNSSTGLTGTNLVVLTGSAHDGDLDTASADLDLTPQLVFRDDGPSIGNIDNSIVDFVSGATVTKTLNGAVGADPNAAPYTIDSFTASVTVNGVEVRGVLAADKQSVTYFADTGGNGTFGDAGDTPFYKLTLNQGGAGTYTFDVLVNPPPAEVDFNFEELPSGQNLFGMLGDPTTGLIVFGKVPVIHPDGTYTNASNTINTSKGGGGTTIGVNNQMFDPGEGAYFTFVKSPDPRFLGVALDANEADDADNMLYAGGTLEVDNGFLNVVQTQGGGAQTMKLSAFNMNGSPQGRDLFTATRSPVNITEVKRNGVVVFSGSAASVNVTVAAGDLISWKTSGLHDQVLVEGVAGKWDIGGFGTTQGAPTPDQALHFVARATDGDGDFATDNFSIGIDGTGIHDDGVVAGVTVSSLSSLFSSEPVDELDALLA